MSLTPEEHHLICKESMSTFKEYVCLKLKPIYGSQTRMAYLCTAIFLMILGGGVWSGANSVENGKQNVKIEEMKKDHVEFKVDILDRIDRLETNQNERLGEFKEDSERHLNTLKEDILKAIEGIHSHE